MTQHGACDDNEDAGPGKNERNQAYERRPCVVFRIKQPCQQPAQDGCETYTKIIECAKGLANAEEK